MMHLSLPGRMDSEPEDYEAQTALRTLLDGEHIKHCGDEELLSRVADQIAHNKDMLDRVSVLVDGLLNGEGEDEVAPLFSDAKDPAERTDTRTIEDFLLRINRVRKKEHLKNVAPMGGKSYG